MESQTAILKQQKSALDDSLVTAISLWAEATTDSSTPRLDNLLQYKRQAVQEFFLSSGKPVPEASPLDVKAWRTLLEKRRLACSTIYAKLSFLSSFYRWAMSNPQLGPFLKANPVDLARPKAPKAYQTRATQSLSDEQLLALAEILRQHAESHDLAAKRDYALFLFYMASGMRRSEILLLRGRDLELTDNGIILTARVKGGDYIGRHLGDPAVREALLDYLEASKRMSVLKTHHSLWTRHDRAGKPGAALSGFAFVKRMKGYAKEAGIEHFHLHQTRHTYARIVAEASGSITETQDALGHKNPATTRIYVQRIAIKRDKFSGEIARRLKR